MIKTLSEYLFAIANLIFVFWSVSAMVYVWYRTWYVERLWREPDDEKTERAVNISGEIFDLSKALMIGTSWLFVLYAITYLIHMATNL